MKQETLNSRLNRLELAIESLADKINQIKPADISKKDVMNMISDSISEIKPQDRDISEQINDVIERDVTKEFITGLYRGK